MLLKAYPIPSDLEKNSFDNISYPFWSRNAQCGFFPAQKGAAGEMLLM